MPMLIRSNKIDPSGNDGTLAETEAAEEGSEILDAMNLLFALTFLTLLSRALGNTKINAEFPFRANHYTSLAAVFPILVGGINSSSGQNFVTTDYYFTGKTAKTLLALPRKPEVYINLFVFKFGDALVGPTTVTRRYGEPGGGTEYVTSQPIPVLRRAPIVVPLFDMFE